MTLLDLLLALRPSADDSRPLDQLDVPRRLRTSVVCTTLSDARRVPLSCDPLLPCEAAATSSVDMPFNALVGHVGVEALWR